MNNWFKWIFSSLFICLFFNSHKPKVLSGEEMAINTHYLHTSNEDLKINVENFYAEAPKILDKDVEVVVTWNTLKNVRYEEKPDPTYKVVYKPIYGKTIRELEDKTIQIKGFIIPITSNTFALSKNPFASCFFCGQAGPETVMGIQFRKLKDKLKTDMFVTLKGKFVLNYDNPDDWMYHIIDAEIIEIR